MKKKMKTELVTRIDLNTFDGEINEVISNLQNLKKRYTKKYDKLTIIAEQGWDCVEIYLSGERLETDKEFDKRIGAIDLKKRRSEQRERAMLARLKEKYEDVSVGCQVEDPVCEMCREKDDELS